MGSNFAFLKSKFDVLACLGEQAERYYKNDPNSCLIKLGMLGEMIVNLMYRYDNLELPYNDTSAARIDKLYNEELLSDSLADILHLLRKRRNRAVHENYGNAAECETLLRSAYALSEWFMQIYGDWDYQHQEFVLPAEETATTFPPVTPQQEEEKIKELGKAAEKKAKEAKAVSKSERKKQVKKTAWNVRLTEAETRILIDEQLREVGWEADTETCRHSKGTRPEKGHDKAIAEWPTDSENGRCGYVDYALFIGEKLVGIIEAKAIQKDISSVIDHQGRGYAKNIRREDEKYTVGTWGDYKVPFVFVTNGRPYLSQLETKSGIWFLDMREQSNIPKAQKGWMSPQNIKEVLEKDTAKADAELKNLDYDPLKDPAGLALRDYQIRAVQAAEKAICDGRESILLAMATGTGKTRTVLGLIYRFLKTQRFGRILYLVDRNSLAAQAEDVFKNVKLEDGYTLNELYDIKTSSAQKTEQETCLRIATVQSMIRQILDRGGDTMPGVSDYDLIIIDEAHRGYILDRDMSEADLLYRDQRDYQSKYRHVIEYFNAVKIALTATPALHTVEIFGDPVFTYSYREAVIDGYLIDHDVPHTLKTKLGEGGIHYKKGDIIKTYNPETRELKTFCAPDELDFDIETFNRKVINRSFNETVLREIADYIDPEGEGKTLIYAVNDSHADMIVDILRNCYCEKGVSGEAIMKITGKAGGGDPKKIQDAIRKFRTTQNPNIVVTVDLLTTGIDIPRIINLVFMRRVKSRILFEQMMGRATRRCDEIGKDHFDIYDPVHVYDAMEDVNTMRPVVTNTTQTFLQLLRELEDLTEEVPIRSQIDRILAKLQRRKVRMTEKTDTYFKGLADGKTPGEFIQKVKEKSPKDAKEYLLAQAELFRMLTEVKDTEYIKIIDEKKDTLLDHTRDYGKADSAEDYLESFENYIHSHKNENAALQIICTRPKDLTAKELKELALTLDREGFTEVGLNRAISEGRPKEIVADLITIIRRYALGTPLVDHKVRVERAIERLCAKHKFTRIERSWIDKIADYLQKEPILRVETFQEDSRFKTNGGIQRMNKIFNQQLGNIVEEINEYLYDEGSAV